MEYDPTTTFIPSLIPAAGFPNVISQIYEHKQLQPPFESSKHSQHKGHSLGSARALEDVEELNDFELLLEMGIDEDKREVEAEGLEVIADESV
ncbi:96b3fca0-601b-41bc-91d6-fe4cbe580cf9-CDS [Sclerotinia trifoliorum]|uniref:96b3fca0-601b-41bc-91d6-fe4cbe580cf9-CDS n=1 Tax=Sclerotinia trifoliorum TaxID=28548 RepID=A0A8H2ZRG4_9HELO|nr:96b3fca0-601b-41bc-91d6-fe4cbe580cf9-CDS [Sclerotinia trifoliorum]